MMNMYFETAVKLKNILFEGVNTYSVKDIAIVSVISFLVTIAFSALLALKDVIAAKRKMNPLVKTQPLTDSSMSLEESGSQLELLSSLRIPTNVGVVRRQKLRLFLLEALLHTIKFGYGYMLMLIVMTYSVWLTMAVILGSGVGYFLFNPLSSHAASVYSRPPSSRHTCCEDDGISVQEVSIPPPSLVNSGQDEPIISLDNNHHVAI